MRAGDRLTPFARRVAETAQRPPDMDLLADLLERVVEAKVEEHFRRERHA